MPAKRVSSPPAAAGDLAAVGSEAKGFADRFHTVLLGSVSDTGRPALSYAPYVCDPQQRFYLLVSDLAAHTANLLRQGRGEVLFIEEEAQARNPFARRRLSLSCEVQEIARDSDQFEPVVARMEHRFGNTVTLLRGLADFRLLRLTPSDGRYVVGFGRAYRITVSDGRFVATGPIEP